MDFTWLTAPVKKERNPQLEAYQAYQENIRKSERAQCEILIGLHKRESIHSLFLKAVEAISLMTNNQHFYNQIKEEITAWEDLHSEKGQGAK